jgi:hypothetical protein
MINQFNVNKIFMQLDENTALLKEIDKLLVKVTISNDNLRNKLFAGFFRNARSAFHAIDILIEKKLYNPAFSLIRVLFDNVIRALYMYNEFDDTQLSSDYLVFPKTKKMCKKLDSIYEDDFFEDIRYRVYGAMCDYTHIGINQIARNFNEQNATLEANFSDGIILDALIGCNTLIKLFATMYFEKVGLKQGEITNDEIKKFHEKYLEDK